MIGLISALTIGLLLFLALLVFAIRLGSTARGFHSVSESSGEQGQSEEFEACPPELVARIFSRADWELISRTHSSSLERLFLQERRKVALFWVRHTSRGIRQVMRKHTEAARNAADIRFRTELSLFLFYMELLLMCETLDVLITTVGPSRLQRIASYVHELSREFNYAHEAFARSNAGGATETSSSS